MSRVLKDKNRPKGPMSAYACFVQVIREEHKRKHPGEHIVFSDFSKKCAERWKVMTAKEKKRFEDMSALDKERFNREMVDYVPPEGVKKGKKRKAPKDPTQPKRAWSAFFFFCDEFRGKIKEEHPDWKVADIAKELGRRWEDCSDKPKYEALAQQDKQRYEEVAFAILFSSFCYLLKALISCLLIGNYVPPKKESKPEPAAVVAPDVAAGDAHPENGADDEEDDAEAEEGEDE
ncbi:unnamed protein product [Schistocephalus solidus]|uniref:High mobility group protein B1 n=1 Tax=Schistocephalus solidus TaxID=70667 RepID=A0A183SKN2_SCHSO|nr:unnamed protein product [Schistocephalus solidus]